MPYFKCVVSLLLLFHITVVCSKTDKNIISEALGLQPVNTFLVDSNLTVNIVVGNDMILSVDQFKQLFGTSNRDKRKGYAYTWKYWPSGLIHYEIEGSLENAAEVIKQAMQYWSNYTCLVFKENSNHWHGVKFVGANYYASQLGYNGYRQNIYVKRSWISLLPNLHEIGHAIGFFHELSRPDRNSYVRVVHTTDINYAIMGSYINTYGIKYDYLSAMHYVSNGLITTLDPAYQNLIGRGKGLSFKDIKLANLMYQCHIKTGNCAGKTCPFNGFVFFKEYKGQPKCECFCESEDLDDPLVPCSSITKEAHIYNITLSSQASSNAEPPCLDIRQNCAALKVEGLCLSEPQKMYFECTKTCGHCAKEINLCVDHANFCHLLASSCTDVALKSFMANKCPKTCRICTNPQTACDIQKMLNQPVSSSPALIVKILVWVPYLVFRSTLFYNQ